MWLRQSLALVKLNGEISEDTITALASGVFCQHWTSPSLESGVATSLWPPLLRLRLLLLLLSAEGVLVSNLTNTESKQFYHHSTKYHAQYRRKGRGPYKVNRRFPRDTAEGSKATDARGATAGRSPIKPDLQHFI